MLSRRGRQGVWLNHKRPADDQAGGSDLASSWLTGPTSAPGRTDNTSVLVLIKEQPGKGQGPTENQGTGIHIRVFVALNKLSLSFFHFWKRNDDPNSQAARGAGTNEMVRNWFLSSPALPCCCFWALTWVSPPASPHLCLDLCLDLGLKVRDDGSLLPCISTTIWGPANSWGWFHEAGLFSHDTLDLPHFVRFQVGGPSLPPGQPLSQASPHALLPFASHLEQPHLSAWWTPMTMITMLFSPSWDLGSLQRSTDHCLFFFFLYLYIFEWTSLPFIVVVLFSDSHCRQQRRNYVS